MNERQQMALQLLRANPKRDLYEGASRYDTNTGSGDFYITYSPGSMLVLTRGDVDGLVSAGLIKRKYPRQPEIQSYVLT